MSGASPSPLVVVFYHLRKMGGTSMRDAFSADGRYWSVPYCLSESDALRRILERVDRGVDRAPGREEPRIFWENHCAPKIIDAPRLLGRLRERVGAQRVFAFATLRHPRTLVPSEYNYFHNKLLPFEDFVSLNSELLLYGTRTCDVYPFLGLKPERGAGSCDSAIRRVHAALSALDAVLFVENVSSWRARLPEEILRGRLPISNARVYRARNASWIERHNGCSMRVYEHVRSRLDH